MSATIAVTARAASMTPPATAAAAALAAAQTAEQELWLVVRVNRSEPGEPVLLLRLPDGRLLARASDLKRWRLPLPAGAPRISGSDRFYALDALPGLTYSLDEEHQALLIDAPPGLFPTTRVSGRPERFSMPPPVSTGAYLNYNVSVQHSRNRTQTGGLLETGLFNSWGVGVADFLVRDYGNAPHVLRLQTTWTKDMPSDVASLRIGDAITGSGGWGRSVRFGGIQWATNFATQPGFIPFPLPQFTGEAALPSTVDLMVDNVRRMSLNVPAGPFNILNLPVVTGAGNAQIVVRDLLGRERTIAYPYYASPTLLRPGLNDFSYEAGFVRDNFGSRSNDYGRFAAVATHRYGFNDWLTGGFHAELLRNQQTAGGGLTFLAADAGTFSAAIAGSHSTSYGNGALVDLGFEHRGHELTLGGDIQLASRDFRELGIQPGELAPRQQTRAFISLSSRRYGSVGLSYSAQLYRYRDPVRLLSASYNRMLGSFGYLSASVAHLWGNPSSTLYSVTVTQTFGGSTSASASVFHQGDTNQAVVNMQRNLPVGNGYGYRVEVGVGDNAHGIASLILQNEFGTYTLDGERSNGESSFRGDVTGSIVTFGGETFLSRYIDQSFGVVQVPGFANVRVYDENQLVGTTNAAGDVLVPRLRPYEKNQIRIDQADLPLDARIGALQLPAVPGLRSGVLVKFPVQRSRSGTIKIILDDGKPLPTGTIVQLVGQPNAVPVGIGGQVYLTGLEKQNEIRASWRGQTCEIELPFEPTSDPLPDLGTFVCKGVAQ